MLKEAIEKIQELVESRNKVQTIDIDMPYLFVKSSVALNLS